MFAQRTRRRPTGTRTALTALVALALAGCQSDEILPGQTEAKDREARLEHYETSALTFYDGGNYPRAEVMAERWLAEQPGDKKARRVLAGSKLQQATPRKLREAEAILVELVKLDWPHPTRGDISFEVQSDLAQTYTLLADLYDRDVRELDGRLRGDTTSSSQETLEQLEGQRRQRDELLAKALPLWEQVLAKSKDNPHALAALAKGNLQLGRDEAGIHYAQRYLGLSQSSQVGWQERMKEYEATARKQDGTLDDRQRGWFVQRVTAARDREKGIHLLLGSVYMRRQQYVPAIDSFSNVIRLDPSVPAAYAERAQAYAAMSQFGMASTDLEEYLKITDPQYHRNERVLAMEKLERWRKAAGTSR